MEEPLCLVRNGPDGVLRADPTALEVLSSIGQPVVVVAIAGRYRTGKSFLMNRLAQRRTGFPLGHAVQAHTKGIWMWCLPHPRRADTTLVLLDTEGLGDPDKGDSCNDAWIFTLALLLSSTLVYNSSGTIDQQALETLGVVTALTERVRVRAGDSGDAAAADFVRFFPGFIWAVRDFVLELAVNGRLVNEDEYLEHVLRLRPGSSRVVQEQNELRRCLRDFFPNRKCFVLPPPAEPEAMTRLEELEEGQLRPRFLQQADAFCRHIWDTAPVKALPGQAVVTGRMLASLAEKYVEAIGSSGVLCLENVVTALATAENTAAVAAAVAEYRQRMEQELKLPTASQEELGEAHQRCERGALALFMARVFADKEQRYQLQLMSELEAAKEEFCRHNEAASEERSLAVLQELWRDVEQRLDRGEYAVLGGSRRFQEHLGELREEYHQRPGLGVKAAAVLEKFLQEREVLVRALCAADQQLSELEKKRVASEAVAVAEAATAVRVLEARQEEQRRSLEEHQQQLEERLRRQQRVMLEEQERVIEHKMREQQALLQEGFECEAEALGEQIQRLQEEKEEMKKPSWRQRALDGLGIAADVFLPGLAWVVVPGTTAVVPSPLRVPQDQQALLQDAFQCLAKVLQEQIKRLQEDKEEMEKPCHQLMLDGLSITADIFLPGLALVLVPGTTVAVPSPLPVPQEQQAPLQDAFQWLAKVLQELIRRLQEDKEEKKNPWRQRALVGLSITADIFLPGLAWVVMPEAMVAVPSPLCMPQEQQEAFEQFAKALREEIRRLQKNKERKKPFWCQRVLKGLGIAAEILLPVLFRVAVSGAVLKIWRVP